VGSSPAESEVACDPPLAGLRVVELARILAGPWAGQVLADLGADVIKVENPNGGDDTRGWGPPYFSGADGSPTSAAYYHATNRGKRSVTADLKTPDGQARVRQLVAEADVVIENFRVGGLAKYGLDYSFLSALNPRLIYCSITGFGQSGPYADRAGYDLLIQAMGGLMHVTGPKDGRPTKAGVATADLFTGLYAVIAIQAALRDRDRTGLGQHIDLALLDAQIAMLANQNMNYLASGRSPTRLGNNHPNIVPYQDFETSDGFVIIACGNDGQFQRLCAALGLDGLSDDARFATNAARVSNREACVAEVEAITRTMTREAVLAACEESVVPAGPINDVADVFADPQVQHRELKRDLPSSDAKGGQLPSVRTPINFSRSPLVLNAASPALGGDDPDDGGAVQWRPRARDGASG